MTDTPIPDDSTANNDLLHVAWSIIANAADWRLDDKQSHEWVKAAKRWRDDYHKTLQVSGEAEAEKGPSWRLIRWFPSLRPGSGSWRPS